MLGDTTTHDRLVRQLAVGAHAAVVFVDYDRSPEAYPVAIKEDYAVTKYVAEHPAEFNVDASRPAIAGDSVGGNITAVVSLLAKERKGPAITAQLLFYPSPGEVDLHSSLARRGFCLVNTVCDCLGCCLIYQNHIVIASRLAPNTCSHQQRVGV